jgi:hypothetical protein
VVDVKTDAILEACRGQWLQAWAEEPSTRLGQPRIEAPTVTVVEDKKRKTKAVVVQAKLVGGTFAEWHAARPELSFTGATGKERRIGGMVRSKHLLSGQVSLSDPDVKGRQVTFVARTTTAGASFGGHPLAVKPAQVDFDAKKASP